MANKMQIRLTETEESILVVEIDRVGPITIQDARRELMAHNFRVQSNTTFISQLRNTGFKVEQVDRSWLISKDTGVIKPGTGALYVRGSIL